MAWLTQGIAFNNPIRRLDLLKWRPRRIRRETRPTALKLRHHLNLKKLETAQESRKLIGCKYYYFPPAPLSSLPQRSFSLLIRWLGEAGFVRFLTLPRSMISFNTAASPSPETTVTSVFVHLFWTLLGFSDRWSMPCLRHSQPSESRACSVR